MAKQTERLVRKKSRESTFEQRTDSDSREFYQSYRWRKFREKQKAVHRKLDELMVHELYKNLPNTTFRSYIAWLDGEDPLCVDCTEAGHIRPGNTADHIHRIRSGGSPFDPNNIQFLCTHHHNSKSGREANEQQQ